MKVTTKESEQGIFPCLMETKEGTIVLFSRSKCGIVLVPDENNNNIFGEIREDWIMDRFSMSSKLIEIENA